jgi:hypothetical protein
MKKPALIFILCSLYSVSGFAQWAVLDEEARKILLKINEVRSIGDKKLENIDFATQKKLSEKFESVVVANPEKYIGTSEDCGDKKINESHYNACMGLRRLRLISLEQTEAIIDRLEKRRKNISDLIAEGRQGDFTTQSGQLQRLQLELQGHQAEMQNDAMELEALRYGYKQREKMYEMQMAEARRATDTRAPAGPGEFKITLPVPFPGK